MQKAKKYANISQTLNKLLQKLLNDFSNNKQWTDINNWLGAMLSTLKDNPSPFINQKVLLSKRLNQCMNPTLPDKPHQLVLKIHQILFHNLRVAAQGNINDYIKLFSQDLGIYSISLLPYFAQSSVNQHRLMCLQLINNYYLDLGKQLIPMLSGFMKSLLPVYGKSLDTYLKNQIQRTLKGLLNATGRKYFVGAMWSSILKYNDCRAPGLSYLSQIIQKMQFIKGQQDYSQSHGFSQQQQQLRRQLLQQSQNKRTQSIGRIKSLKQSPKILSSQKNISIQLIQPPQKQNKLSSPQKQLLKNLTNIQQQQKQSQNQIQHSKQLQTPIKKIVSDNLPIKGLKKIGGKNILDQQSQKIQLDQVPLMLTPGIQSIKQGIDNNTIQNNYPNANTLVVSALVSCLQDDTPIIKRSALDFMFSHLRLKSNVITDADRMILVEAAIRLFRKKQISIIKRVNRWLFGRQDQQNQYHINQKNQFVIPLLIESLNRILNSQPKNQQDCIIPLKILQNFYIQHHYMVHQTLKQVSLSLLRYIFNYGAGYQFSQEITKAGKRFLQNLPSYYPIILSSLSSIFVAGVQQNKQHQCFQAVKYVDFCYVTLMKHQHGTQQLQYITMTLQDLSLGLKLVSQRQKFYCGYMKDAILLLYNLLSRRQSVLRFIQKQQQKINKKYLQQTGLQSLPQQRINYQKSLQYQQQKQQLRYINILQNLQLFFIKLGQIIKVTPNIQIYQQTFKICALAIVKIQYHLPKKSITTLPNWFSTIQSGIRVSNPIISLSAIQAMINCLMWQKKHPIYNSFKNIIILQKNKKIGNDYQKLALQKLWSLLDFPHMHSKIIDLIVAFSKYFPNQFSNTVKRSFTTHNVPQKQASIQRFSHFWRLTGFKYKDLLVNNQQFRKLNQVGLFVMLDFLDDQNPLVRHAAKNWLMQSMALFYRIIEPLFVVLMKACQDWYQTPKGIYLIKNVYDTNLIFNTFRRIRSILSNGSYLFLRYIYQTQISDTLQQMRQKVTTINKPIITQDAIKIQPQLQTSLINRQPVLRKSLQNQIHKQINMFKKLTYMDLLVILSVKYIQGQALQSMGVQFYIGNSGVSTSSVQLIQTLLDYIDSPLLCNRLINYIMPPLFKVLNQVVINRQYIIQIQLLNLYTVVLFSSSFRKKGQLKQVRNFFKTIFTNDYFISSLLKGLNTPFSYVRGQFINFITICIPLIADFLQPQDCTKCIKQIIFTYYKIIKQIRISLVEEVLAQQQQRAQKVTHIAVSRIQQLQMKVRQQQKIVKLTNNLQQVAKTNQILSVLHGLSTILNYFYDLDKLDIKSLKFEFTNPYTILDTVKSILTLGFSSSQKDGKLISKTNFLHNLDTCQSILRDLSPVYQTILRAWPLSQQYVRIATQQFSGIGMKAFNFQRFSIYNRVLKDLIVYVDQQKQSIWGKIFSIMQPMFYKFPTQITDIYLKLWIRQCPDPDNNGKIVINSQKTQFLMKIVQTIIVNNFPINVVIHALIQTSTVNDLIIYNQKKSKDTKKGVVLQYNNSTIQAKVLYFIYVYFHYVYLDQKNLNKQNLLEIWSTIMKSLKPFLKSKTPSTVLWILQILDLCGKKYSPKQLLVIQRFKSDLHGLLNQKLKYLASVASKKQILFYQEPNKIGFDGAIPLNQYKMVLPLPPCLYENYRKRQKQANDTDRLLFYPVRPGDTIQIERRTRLMAFKSLKSIALQLLQNMYLPQKNQWVIVRTCQWIQIILPSIQDKSTDNMLFAQSASEVLYDLLQKAKILFIKPLRSLILKIFNKDQFFICNINTLNYWSKIIDWVVSSDKNNQTFTQYLQKVSLSNSYFTNVSTQNKKRIKSFQRICFILYSGSRDRYAQKIKQLLEKIAQVISKAQQAHPALLILILFSIRILILRLSQICLNQLFIIIWPMLLALLMQLFTKKLVKVQIASQISRNPNLLLAALKFVQMISLFNLSEFAYHQWIFIFDYFGIQITMPQSNDFLQFISKRPQLKNQLQPSRNKQDSPFIYKPYLSNYFPEYSIDYIPKKSNQIVKYEPKKRTIIIQDSFIQDQNQLKIRALALAQYLASINQFRVQVNSRQVQMSIVNDFINLDSFIHKIS